MHIALNGYFWDQPHTGSGQYTRHLWAALSQLVSQLPDKDAHKLTLALPRDDSEIDSKNPKSKIQNPKSKIGKLLWEQQAATQQAKRQGAHLLHVPYLAAPLVRRLPIVVTAHDMIPWIVP